MVVLSTAMEPSEGTKEIAEILNVGTTEDEFIKEAHPKIKPVTTDIQGTFVLWNSTGSERYYRINYAGYCSCFQSI